MSNYIQKDFSKRQLVWKQQLKRLHYKYIIKNQNISKQIRSEYTYKLNGLNKNGCKSRIQNRCIISGRARAVYKLFRLSRIKFRELAGQGMLPGVMKASW